MSADGNALWAWQVQEPNGRWSLILAVNPVLAALTGAGATVLIHSNQVVAKNFETLARDYATQTGQPIRFVRFDLAKEEE